MNHMKKRSSCYSSERANTLFSIMGILFFAHFLILIDLSSIFISKHFICVEYFPIKSTVNKVQCDWIWACTVLQCAIHCRTWKNHKIRWRNVFCSFLRFDAICFIFLHFFLSFFPSSIGFVSISNGIELVTKMECILSDAHKIGWRNNEMIWWCDLCELIPFWAEHWRLMYGVWHILLVYDLVITLPMG